MSAMTKVEIELSVLAGNSIISIQQFLKLGRGAIIELDTSEDDPAILLANNIPIAIGEIDFDGDKILFKITEKIERQAGMPTPENALFALRA